MGLYFYPTFIPLFLFAVILYNYISRNKNRINIFELNYNIFTTPEKGYELTQSGYVLTDKTSQLIDKGNELAQKSNDLIEQGNEAVQNSFEHIEKGNDFAQKGYEKIENSYEVTEKSARLSEITEKDFSEVVNIMIKLKEIIDEVTTASGEQSRGIEQISNTVAEMNNITQNNASSSEESAAASEGFSQTVGS